MKTKLSVLRFATLVFGLLASATCSRGFAQGPAFTYQGRLDDGASPANGAYDLKFSLFKVSSNGVIAAGPLTNAATAVSNGLFTVTLDFGASAFDGNACWLEIAVRPGASGGAYTNLIPRQPLTATPYAVRAANFSGAVADNQLSANMARLNAPAVFTGPVSFSSATGSFSGAFTGNGAGVTNVNAATLGGLGAANFWIVGGNAGIGGAGLGTVDSQPLKLIAGNRRALQLETKSVSLGLFDSWSAVNVLGGASGNVISNGVMGGTIAGGGALTNHLFGFDAAPNTVLDNYCTIGGGIFNTAGLASADFDDARSATVAGGENNTAGGAWATVGGGNVNNASVLAATVGGGFGNTADGGWATVAGGFGNTASGDGATVPGGYGNHATGSISFAAGFNAYATNDGTFVWADSTGGIFASSSSNQFLIRASGGVGIGTGSPGAQLDVASSGNTRIRISGPVGGGTGVTVACEFATYSPGLNPPSARILATDDGNWSNDLDLMTKIPGAAGNALQSRLHIASGGNVGIGTNSPSQKLHVIGNILASGTITGSSDRNVKEHFASVNPRDVLEKVSALPITEWNYKADNETLRHIGPMAQDFYSAFNVGMDDKHISMVDADGVALAAIQGLNQKLTEELKRRDAENTELKQRLEKLEQLMSLKLNGGAR